jgi:signal transduction protein with GAF and PtsI domain
MTQEDLETKMKRIVETVDIANVLSEPLTSSIRNLLELAASSMRSEEASVIVADEDGNLSFLVAIGKVADQLHGITIPAGKGIAGFVYSSGQPMVIADAGNEDSFYAEVDKQTGYATQTLLATPLRFKDNVIGVLEFVNRIGSPPYEAFTPLEMDKAALFADSIAALVNAYNLAKGLQELTSHLLGAEGEPAIEEVGAWLRQLRSSDEHKRLISIALLVRQIGALGENEMQLCREVLEAFLKHSRSLDGTGFRSDF